MKKRLVALLLAVVIIVGLIAIGILTNPTTKRTEKTTTATAGETYLVGYAKADISPWIKDYPGTTNMQDEEGNEIGIPYISSWGTNYIATNNLVVNTQTGQEGVVATLKDAVGYSGGTFTTPTDANGDGKIGQGDGIYTTATAVTDSQGNSVLFLTLDAIAGYSVEKNISDIIAKQVSKETGVKLSADCIYLNGSHTHRGIDPSRLRSGSASAPAKAYWIYYQNQIINAAVAAYKNSTPATMSKGQIDASDASGLQLNFIRHYVAKDDTEVIAGTHFGGWYHNKIKKIHLYEADDMMYLLKFTPVDTEQKPIMLVNWRAHGTIMGTGGVFSPDYIGSLRAYLEKAGYNATFLQGAGGNAVPQSAISGLNKWYNQSDWGSGIEKLNYTNADEKTLYINYYGYLLSEIAQKCEMSELNEGMIRTLSSVYAPEKQQDSYIQVEGARYWNTHKNNTTFTFPWTYTNSKNETYVFDSKYQVQNIYSRITKTAQSLEMTVNAIMLGDQVAMVTCGNELSDRYTKTDTLQYDTTKEQWYISGDDNDWKDLQDTTYGTPFVLAYTNGTHAYMSNYLSYQYNAENPICGGGCYESQTSSYAAGTGEALIAKFDEMLNILNGGAVSDSVS